MEKQTLNVNCEIKSIDEQSMKFVAYGSTFDVDLVNDRIEKGAYTKVIEKAKRSGKYPKLLYQHNYKDVIGVIEGLQQDDKGLLVQGRFIDTSKGRDAYVEVKEGAIDSMSIGFIPGINETEKDIRVIKEIDSLLEISFVTFPANPSSTVLSIKQKNGIINVRDLEKHLRDVGFSRNEAKVFISGGISELKQRDAELSEEKNIELVSSLNAVIARIKGSK